MYQLSQPITPLLPLGRPSYLLLKHMVKTLSETQRERETDIVWFFMKDKTDMAARDLCFKSLVYFSKLAAKNLRLTFFSQVAPKTSPKGSPPRLIPLPQRSPQRCTKFLYLFLDILLLRSATWLSASAFLLRGKRVEQKTYRSFQELFC